MADAPLLDETVLVGDADHAGLHSDVNRSTNLVRTNLDTHTALGATAHGGIISPTAFDAKGDLLVGTAADNFARLPVGADDQIPYADSSQAGGIRWDDLPSFNPSGAAITVQDEGTSITTPYGILNFRGAGVTATEDAVNNRINIDISTATTTVVQKTVPSDQSIASSTTLTDGSSLNQSVAIGEVWEVSGLLAFRADVTADFKLTMVAPTGSVQVTRAEGLNATATSETSGSMHAALYGPSPAARAYTGLGTPAGNEVTVKIDGRLAVGGTAGSWKMQWAQNASSATASVLLAGSYLTFARVS